MSRSRGTRPRPTRAFADAEVTVRARYSIPRLAVAPMEGRGILAIPLGPDRLQLYASTQAPHWTRAQLARSLGMPFDRLRVITPHVGGGFGGKAVGGVAAYVIAAAAALRLGRAVRYVEGRGDNLATMQGRGLHFDVALHARRRRHHRRARGRRVLRRGRLPRRRLDRARQDQPHGVRALPGARSVVPGPQRAHQPRADRRVPRARALGSRRGARAHARSARTRPRHRPRGDPRPQPRDARGAPRRVPYRRALRRRRLPRGARHAPGACELSRNCAASRNSAAREKPTRALGIGIATVVDSTAWFTRQETACVSVLADGTVRVLAGTASAGQQHERAYATLVAEVLPVSVDDVEVIEGDTELVEGSAGTSGSRSLQLAGSAVRGAALDVLEQARRLAADLLEAAVDDIVVDDTAFIVRGVPPRFHPRPARGARRRARKRSLARRPLRVRSGRRDVHPQRAPVARRGRHRHGARHAAPPLRSDRLRPRRRPTVGGGPDRRRERTGHRAGAVRGVLVRRVREPAHQQPRRVPRAQRPASSRDRRPVRRPPRPRATPSAHGVSAK